MRAVVLLRALGLAALVPGIAAVASAQAPAASATPAAAVAPAAPEAAAFPPEHLEQLAAPIALYPDSLVAQILMASTYPLEIVEAARWVKANPSLKGKELEAALQDQDWALEVKALAGIPEVLQRMNDNLDWTQDLGDAFLTQRADLMDAIQRMRGKAYEAGKLKTSEQQVVTQQQDKIIVIESASPEVVYVPSYSPQVVYVGYAYPTYYYPAYPWGAGAMAFTAGVFWGAALSGGCGWGWGGGDIDIDIDRNTNFERNVNRESSRTNVSNRSGDRASGGKGNFNHDPSHRGGVNYRDNKTAQQFGGQGGSSRVTRDQARGYDRGGAGGRQTGATTRDGGGAGSRQTGATPRAGGGAGGRDAAASSRAGSGGSQRAAASSRAGGGSSRNSAYSGSRNSGFDRASSSRGSMSRGGGGGFSRGGGGRRR
jgi:hypothetical protein